MSQAHCSIPTPELPAHNEGALRIFRAQNGLAPARLLRAHELCHKISWRHRPSRLLAARQRRPARHGTHHKKALILLPCCLVRAPLHDISHWRCPRCPAAAARTSRPQDKFLPFQHSSVGNKRSPMEVLLWSSSRRMVVKISYIKSGASVPTRSLMSS